MDHEAHFGPCKRRPPVAFGAAASHRPAYCGSMVGGAPLRPQRGGRAAPFPSSCRRRRWCGGFRRERRRWRHGRCNSCSRRQTHPSRPLAARGCGVRCDQGARRPRQHAAAQAPPRLCQARHRPKPGACEQRRLAGRQGLLGDALRWRTPELLGWQPQAGGAALEMRGPPAALLCCAPTQLPRSTLPASDPHHSTVPPAGSVRCPVGRGPADGGRGRAGGAGGVRPQLLLGLPPRAGRGGAPGL